jgi:NAD(P)-dependent dehydrogenase (short-subunit alcohol dehydrogenase family)
MTDLPMNLQLNLQNKSIVIVGQGVANDPLVVGIAETLRGMGASVRITDPSGIAEPFHAAIIVPTYRHVGEFMDTSPHDWYAAFDENFETPVYTGQEIAKRLIAAGGGSIIYLISVMGLMPFSETSIVGTSHSALWALARMAAVDLAPHGIRVNAVAAGWVGAAWEQPYTDSGQTFIAGDTPLGRIGTPDDVGRVCAFLISDLAGFVTGVCIPVDGGYLVEQRSAKSPYPQKPQE